MIAMIDCGVAFFPQLQLHWKNGQQRAERVGGVAVAVGKRSFIINTSRIYDK